MGLGDKVLLAQSRDVVATAGVLCSVPHLEDPASPWQQPPG